MKQTVTLFLFLLFYLSCNAQEQRPFSGIDYPFDVEYVIIGNGQTIAYHDRGSGNETLILIHGLGSYMPAWTRNISALSESHRVVALDLPGYGKSTKSAENYTIPFFAESVTMLMDELGIDQATIIGHSMGGQIALYMAASSPERAERLVLSAPAGFEQFTEQDRQLFNMTVTAEGIAVTPEATIRQNMAVNFSEVPAEAQFMIEDRIRMIDEPGFEDYADAQAQSVFAMLENPVWDLMPDIQQPALVVFGEQDALIPNRYLHPDLTTEGVARTGIERLPNAMLMLINDAGHFVHFEQPDTFNRAVLEFLNQNE